MLNLNRIYFCHFIYFYMKELLLCHKLLKVNRVMIDIAHCLGIVTLNILLRICSRYKSEGNVPDFENET